MFDVTRPAPCRRGTSPSSSVGARSGTNRALLASTPSCATVTASSTMRPTRSRKVLSASPTNSVREPSLTWSPAGSETSARGRYRSA